MQEILDNQETCEHYFNNENLAKFISIKYNLSKLPEEKSKNLNGPITI